VAPQNWLNARGVVAIGASAGGIDALQRLMHELPAATCVVLPIQASSHDLLSRIITRKTRMRGVLTVEAPIERAGMGSR
jgi:hypothetical protein